MTIIIKILLAILMFGCLLDMPYGYYELVRFISMVGFGILAYQSQQQNQMIKIIIYGSLALLFQPFFKIALGRELWNIADVIVGAGLLVTIFLDSKQKKSE